MENKLLVKCPECDHEFHIDIDKVLAENAEKDIKEKLESEYRKKMKAAEKTQLEMEEMKKKMETIREDAELLAMKKLSEKVEKIKTEAEERAKKKADINLEEALRKLKYKEENLEISTLKRISEESEKVRAEEQLKQAELKKQMEDQKKLVEEMQRKAGQGSMQLQGDVQEMAIGDWLRNNFPLDHIEDIKTGARGADLFQTVNSRTRSDCGSIYYESKRTKDYQKTWIEKFKTDMRARNATFGILITDVMPDGMDRLGQRDGIWICSYTEFKGLSQALREAAVLLSDARAANENKGEKMTMLYDYLTGSEFRSQVEAIVEGFVQMQTDLDKEKIAMEGLWKKREIQIKKVVLNTTYM